MQITSLILTLSLVCQVRKGYDLFCYLIRSRKDDFIRDRVMSKTVYKYSSSDLAFFHSSMSLPLHLSVPFKYDLAIIAVCNKVGAFW